jgi:hypothetical protein
MGSLMGSLARKRIAIVTIEHDLHALAVKAALAKHKDVDCFIIECNCLSGNSGLSWHRSRRFGCHAQLRVAAGLFLPVRDLDVIWWRRANSSQIIPDTLTHADHIDVINNDCRTGLLGVLLTEFHGIWISDPNATAVAENKLVQLRVANDAGLLVPETLVSQNPGHIIPLP